MGERDRGGGEEEEEVKREDGRTRSFRAPRGRRRTVVIRDQKWWVRPTEIGEERKDSDYARCVSRRTSSRGTTGRSSCRQDT